MHSSPRVRRSAGVTLAACALATWNAGEAWDDTVSRNCFAITAVRRQLPRLRFALWRRERWLKQIDGRRKEWPLTAGVNYPWSFSTTLALRRLRTRAGKAEEGVTWLGCVSLAAWPERIIAQSRWEWVTLWRPHSKWQNPSCGIDQWFFCLPVGIFPLSPLSFSRLTGIHSLPPPPLLDTPYWSSLVIGCAVIWDGHWRMSANCFPFSLFLSSRGWWSHNPCDRARRRPIATGRWPEKPQERALDASGPVAHAPWDTVVIGLINASQQSAQSGRNEKRVCTLALKERDVSV